MRSTGEISLSTPPPTAMRCGLAGDQKKSPENKKEAKNQPW